MSDAERPQSPQSADPALDELLRQAAWPEPDPAAIERLRAQWRSLSAERRRRSLRRWISAAAAAVLVAGGAWWFWPQTPEDEIAAPNVPPPEPREVRVADHGPEDSPNVATEQPENAVSERPAAPERGYVWSRPATAYQKFVVASLERRRPGPPAAEDRTNGEPPPAPEADALEQALQALVADPQADVSALVKPLMRDRASHEQRLLEWLPRASVERRMSAIQLLAFVGSPRSVPALLQLSGLEETHAAAVRVIMPHADAILLGDLIWRERDRGLQRELLLALLSRGHSQAVAIYLELVTYPDTREAALAALDAASRPPVEVLSGFLNGADPSQQIAAALALGRLNGRQITQRLIHQALSNRHQQAALVALLANRSDEARRFVSLALRDQSLFAAVHSARLQFQFVQPMQPGDRL